MTPLQTIREGEREFENDVLISLSDGTKIVSRNPEVLRHHMKSQTIALLEAQNVELEGRKRAEEIAYGQVGLGKIKGYNEALKTTIDINNKLIKELRV